MENKDCIVEQLTGLIEKGKQIAASSDSYGHVDQARVNAWRAEILTIVRYAKLDVPEYVDQINNEGNRYRRQVLAMVSTLDTMIEQVKKGILRRAEPVTNPDAELENIFNKFHTLSRKEAVPWIKTSIWKSTPARSLPLSFLDPWVTHTFRPRTVRSSAAADTMCC